MVGRVWSFRDISERERANRDLATSETRYRTLVEQLPAITFLDSADATEAVYLSPQTREVLGYEPEEVFTFEQWRRVIHPDDLGAYVEAVHDAVPARRVVRARAPDGAPGTAASSGCASASR